MITWAVVRQTKSLLCAVVGLFIACSSTSSKERLPAADAGGSGGGVSDAAVDGAGGATADASADAAPDAATDAPGAGYAAAVLADDPVLYLRFEDSGGGAGFQLQNLGSLGEKCNLTSDQLLLGQPGIGASLAVQLNGVGTIQCESAVAFPNKDSFTLEGWFRIANKTVSPQRLIHRLSSKTGSAQGYLLETDLSAGLVARRYEDGNPASVAQLLGAGLPLNKWTYVAATYDGTSSNFCLQLDAEALKCGVSNQKLLAASVLLTIGGPGSNFRGFIDEVAIYAKALPKSRLLEHFAAGKAP